MKIQKHLAVESVIFAALVFLIELKLAVIVTLFHFIPTLDWLMKKANFYPNLSRKLFHNIFVMTASLVVVYHFTNAWIALFCFLNFSLHIVMDLNKKGVALFFPFSEFRLKIKSWK